MKQLISGDDSNFKKLSCNPTKSRENSLISCLRNLKWDRIIDAATFRKILPSGSTAGVLYGLPKIHKTGCPFRPIVSSVNTYNYASINSSDAHPPPPPGQPRGICSRCHSRGWGIRNFIAARGLGISIPRGDPRAFDTRVFEKWMTVKPLSRTDFTCLSGTRKTCRYFKDTLSQSLIFLHCL